MKTKVMICTMVLLLSVLMGTALGGMEGSSNTLFGTGAGNSLGDDDDQSTFIGYQAGYNTNDGTQPYHGKYNTFVGYNAGYSNTTGLCNTFLGCNAGRSTTGSFNTFIGYAAGYFNTYGEDNTFIGHNAGGNNTTGFSNTFLGLDAGGSNTTGYYNTYLGNNAGTSNTTGYGNVFIGNSAGYNETGSNKLYIDNSNTSTPLIYGEFDNRILTIYGDLMLDTNSFDAPEWVKLYGAADNNLVGMAFDSFGEAPGMGGGGLFRFARGSQASKEVVQNGDRLGFFVFAGYDGTNFLNTAAFTAKVDGPVSSGNVPTKFVFETGAAGHPRPERMVISSSGNVGIGTSTPFYPLHMGSGAYVSTGGVWTNASSKEYKDNIKGLKAEDAIETLQGLNPVTFTYKKSPEENHVGFIAEEVPELIATKNRKGLSPMDITAVLTKVVQEQQEMIKKQQETINELSSRLSELEKESKLRSAVANADLAQ